MHYAMKKFDHTDSVIESAVWTNHMWPCLSGCGRGVFYPESRCYACTFGVPGTLGRSALPITDVRAAYRPQLKRRKHNAQ